MKLKRNLLEINEGLLQNGDYHELDLGNQTKLLQSLASSYARKDDHQTPKNKTIILVDKYPSDSGPAAKSE